MPKNLIKNLPGFNDSIHTKSKAVVEKLKKIMNYHTIRLNDQRNGPRTIHSKSPVERSFSLENLKPSSSGSVINLCSSVESIIDIQNESTIKKESKSSFVYKTRKSTSLDNSIEEPSTSSTFDRVRFESGKLQPIQNEKPKCMPPPASSVPFQPPLVENFHCPSPENIVPSLKEESGLDNVDWEEDMQDFNDTIKVSIDDVGWPIYRPEDYEMQDEEKDARNTNEKNEDGEFFLISFLYYTVIKSIQIL